MTPVESAAFERGARETILRLALEEVLFLYANTLGAKADDKLLTLEHTFVVSVHSVDIPDELADGASAARQDAIEIIRNAFDEAQRRCRDKLLSPLLDEALAA